MDWTAKLLEPTVIEIRQDKDACGPNERATYNIHCDNPLINFDVDNGVKVFTVPLQYAGDYVVTRRIRNLKTGLVETSATFVNKDNTDTIEIIGHENSEGEQVVPKKVPRKKKVTSE
jgi:hypothetical protein